MKRARTLLAFTALAASGANASAELYVYCAHVSSPSTTVWDSPFWWIPAGGTPFGISSTGDGVFCDSCYYHEVATLTGGEGFGVFCRDATSGIGCGSGITWMVSVLQPYAPTVCPDAYVSLVSTNADIEMCSGMGTVTGCNAFQVSKFGNKWANVCLLTLYPGALQPEIEFHWVAGSTGRIYADAVKFTFIPRLTVSTVNCVPGPSPGELTIQGNGGCGATFVLLKTPELSAPPIPWSPVATNSDRTGYFSFVISTTESTRAFFRVEAQ